MNKDPLVTFDEELERLQEIKQGTLESIRSRHKEISSRTEKMQATRTLLNVVNVLGVEDKFYDIL